MKLRTPLLASLLFALLLSACSGAAAAPSDYDRGYSEAPMAVAQNQSFEMSADSAASGGAMAPQNTSAERLVIQNASIAIVVDQPEASMEAISQMAQRFGGFVVDSYLYQQSLSSGLQVPYGSITVRVPAERLQEALALIEDGAKTVQSKNLSGQDVTAEYTDLQSRLRNLQDAEVLLRQIMQDAVDSEDILTAFNQLNNITEQIEVLKGQIKYYEEAAALSAISVELTASQAVQPITIAGWEPVGVAKDAIQALISAMQGIVNAVIWLVLYALPILLVLGLPLYFLVRWLRRRRAAAKPAARKTAPRGKRTR